MHAADPDEAAYLPGTHDVQLSAEVDPTTVEYFPFAQGVHSVLLYTLE